MREEIWRDLPGYEELYEISSMGRVKKKPYIDSRGRRKKEFYPAINGNGNGYVLFSTQMNYERKNIYIHRAVARAFPEICGEWFEGCQIDHINCIRNDNRAENLKVCTAKENMSNPLTKDKRNQIVSSAEFKEKISQKAYKRWSNRSFKDAMSKRFKEAWQDPKNKEGFERLRRAIRKSWKPVFRISMDDNTIEYFENVTKAAEASNIPVNYISACLSGRQNSAGGYKWKCADKGVA